MRGQALVEATGFVAVEATERRFRHQPEADFVGDQQQLHMRGQRGEQREQGVGLLRQTGWWRRGRSVRRGGLPVAQQVGKPQAEAVDNDGAWRGNELAQRVRERDGFFNDVPVGGAVLAVMRDALRHFCIQRLRGGNQCDGQGALRGEGFGVTAFAAAGAAKNEMGRHGKGKMAERKGFEPLCQVSLTIRFRVGAVMTTSVPLRNPGGARAARKRGIIPQTPMSDNDRRGGVFICLFSFFVGMVMRFSAFFGVLSALCLSGAMGNVAAAEPDAAELTRCVQGLRGAAVKAGVSQAGFQRLTAGLKPDGGVLESLDYQPEFRTPIWDYLAGLVDDERVRDGRAMLTRWQDTLAQVAQRYGVDAATVVAVWGVESNYGQSFGKKPLLQSLATLSCFGRRQSYFRQEFFSALKIADSGDVPAEQLVGSWAGAFGHTQFMPSTFLRTAVDFDGDGRRDLVGNVPDALASTANFLHNAGWRSGLPWGMEVKLPAGLDVSGASRKNKQPLSKWAARGVTRVDGRPLPADDWKAGLLLPAGKEGPAFLVSRNFDAIYSYNAAESYALAIALLSDALRGGSATPQRPWPTDDPGLSREERREVQRALIAHGYDIGEVDGMLGSASRKAIRDLQQRAGMEADGRAGQKMLRWLREHPGAADAGR